MKLKRKVVSAARQHARPNGFFFCWAAGQQMSALGGRDENGDFLLRKCIFTLLRRRIESTNADRYRRGPSDRGKNLCTLPRHRPSWAKRLPRSSTVPSDRRKRQCRK